MIEKIGIGLLGILGLALVFKAGADFGKQNFQGKLTADTIKKVVDKTNCTALVVGSNKEVVIFMCKE